MNTQRDIERTNQTTVPPAEEAWSAPPFDLFEGPSEYMLVADVPGATEKSLNLRYEKGRLHMEARREVPADSAWPARLLGSVALPDGVAVEEIRASLEGGVLKVTLPKASSYRGREIPINVA